MQIGTLTRSKDGVLSGDLPTLNWHGFLLSPMKKKGEGPDYRATVKGAEVGGGWKKKSTKGLDYISCRLDGPQFHDPIYIAIFKGENSEYAVAWSRMATNKERAAPGNQPLGDDEIPF